MIQRFWLFVIALTTCGALGCTGGQTAPLDHGSEGKDAGGVVPTDGGALDSGAAANADEVGAPCTVGGASACSSHDGAVPVQCIGVWQRPAACDAGVRCDAATSVECVPFALTGFELSAGTLTPALSSSVSDYAAVVPLTTQTVTVTLSAPSGSALSIDGRSVISGEPLPSSLLALGPNTFHIVLSHTGFADRPYTLTVTRGETNAYLKARSGRAGDHLGSAVAVSGDTLVVSAIEEASSATGGPADSSAPRSGAAYVFVRNGTAWNQQAYLKASNAEASDLFGWSVAISGDTVVVAAIGEGASAKGGPADNSAPNSGAAYVFVRTGVKWSQQGYLKVSNAEANDNLGWSAAISGDTVALGAMGEDSRAISAGGGPDDNGAYESGAAYVFVRKGGTWSQQAYLKASNAALGARLGNGIAVSQDTLAVGAAYEGGTTSGGPADNSLDSSGAVYVFVRNADTWSAQAHLKASNPGENDQLGYSVALSGDTLVAGAPYEDGSPRSGQSDDSMPDSGAAYVFVRSSDTWNQQAYLKATNADANDYFGISVGISGDSLVVGAPGESSSAARIPGDNSVEASGAAYLLERSSVAWREQARLKASNAGTFDQFGLSVGISGDTVVVGAPYEDGTALGGPPDNGAEAAGALYVFR